jgi:hypothetical protein
MIIADTDEKFATLAEAEEEAEYLQSQGHRVNGPHKYLDFRGRPYWRLEVEAKNGNGKGRDAADRRARLHRALDVVMDRKMRRTTDSINDLPSNGVRLYANRDMQKAGRGAADAVVIPVDAKPFAWKIVHSDGGQDFFKTTQEAVAKINRSFPNYIVEAR